MTKTEKNNRSKVASLQACAAFVLCSISNDMDRGVHDWLRGFGRLVTMGDVLAWYNTLNASEAIKPLNEANQIVVTKFFSYIETLLVD